MSKYNKYKVRMFNIEIRNSKLCDRQLLKKKNIKGKEKEKRNDKP